MRPAPIWLLPLLFVVAAGAALADLRDAHPPRYYSCNALPHYADVRDEKYFIYPKRDFDGGMLRSFGFVYEPDPVFADWLHWRRQDGAKKHWWAESHRVRANASSQRFVTWIYDEQEGLLASALTTRGTAAETRRTQAFHQTINRDRLRQEDPERLRAIRLLEKRLDNETGLALIEERLARQKLPPAEDSFTRWRDFYRCEEETSRILWHLRNFLNQVYENIPLG